MPFPPAPPVEPEHPFELSLRSLPMGAEGLVRWREVFGEDRPLRLEIGVGKSTFLLEVAGREPAFNYLGFEYSAKRVEKFLHKAAASGLSNIRMLRLNAVLVLERCFAASSIDRIFINHPDPWPKRRHARRRFVAPANASLMTSLLRPGGGISLRTDHAAYAQQMVTVLDAVPELANLAGPGAFILEPLHPFPTPYELKFRAAGSRIYYLEYRKKQ